MKTHHLKAAINLARSLPVEHGQNRVCAIALDKKGMVISVGYNDYTKSHPIQAKYAKIVGLDEKIYLHAEISAIIKARGEEISKLVVGRIGKKGVALPSKPCIICSEAIKQYGIKEIEYV